MKISAVVLSWQEIQYIDRCLTSLQYLDEVILVDAFSNDGTEFVDARYANVKIYKNHFKSISDQRNYGLSKAKNKWCLIIDADEYLNWELQNLLNSDWLDKLNPSIDAIRIPRYNLVDGIGPQCWPDNQIHLVKNGIIHGGDPLHSDRASNAHNIMNLGTNDNAKVIHEKTALKWMSAARMYYYMCPYTFPDGPCPGSEDITPPIENWNKDRDINFYEEFIAKNLWRNVTPEEIADLVVDNTGWHKRKLS